MEPQYQYTIEEITEDTIEPLARPDIDGSVAQLLRAVEMARAKKVGSRAFVVMWDGNKIPRGAKVGDYFIVHTQNGLVHGVKQAGSSPEVIGTYDRLAEFGGKSGKFQVINVYLTKEPGAPVDASDLLST